MHYFDGSSDWYICEIDTEGVAFGYAVINGDTQNAEFGYTNLADILKNPRAELDLYSDQNLTLEHAVCENYPELKDELLTTADEYNRESEAEAHKNRSNAMLGNQNAKKPFSSLTDEEKIEKKESILQNIVSVIEKDSVPYNDDGAFDKAAKAWIQNNPQGSTRTIIGDIIINEKSMYRDMHHGEKKDKYIKLQTIPAIKDVLEKGTYLGYEKDFEGKPIDNHYFAGKIKYGDKEKIIFCRVREVGGNPNRFYVHEVFTEDEIKKRFPIERQA